MHFVVLVKKKGILQQGSNTGSLTSLQPCAQGSKCAVVFLKYHQPFLILKHELRFHLAGKIIGI